MAWVEYVRRSAQRFTRETLTVVAVATLFAAALALIGTTIVLASLRQDASQLAQEQRVVAASLESLEHALAGNVLDYAVWDDAVARLVLDFDPGWARTNIGPTIYSVLGYDLSLVVDATDRVIYAQVGGEEREGSIDGLLGASAGLLIEQARAADRAPSVAVLNGPDGLVVAGAASVNSEEEPAQPPLAQPLSVMLFAKQLDQSFLDRLTDDFELSGLRLLGPAEVMADLASVDLLGPASERVGAIAWQPRRPGRSQLAWLLPAVSGSVLAIAVFAGLALRGFRLARAVSTSESRLRDFADISSDWLWEMDDQLRFSWFSPGFAATTGLDPAALLGRRRDDIHADGGGNWPAHRADLEARLPFRDFTYAYADSNGAERTVRISGKPVFDGAGGFAGYRGTGRDVTAEAQAARQLQESENRFRSLVENLRGILFCRGIAGDASHGYDARGAQVFGADAAKMAGTVDAKGRARIDQWYEAVHPEDRPAYLEAERRRKDHGQPYVIDYRIIHPVTGERRWMRESAWIVEAPEEGRRYFDSYIIDVTEQRDRETALAEARARLEVQNHELSQSRLAAEAAAQAKSEFLAAMSHEIRTPMTSVLGMSDVLAAEPLTPSQRRYVETIRGSGRHLLGVINSILDFSRIEAGKLELEEIDFMVADVLEQVHSLLGPQAAERGLELRFAPAVDRARVIRGDPTRLRQVLVNLVGNALKFTASGSVVVSVGELEAANGQTRLRFEVRDTGIGIPPDRLPELFVPFVQADSSTSRHFGGSGLGLAICKRLTEAMGGTIGAETAPGVGSLFWFELPFALGDPAVLAERTAIDRAGIPALRILVVDDVVVNRDMLAEMLRRQGHDVLLAEHGGKAVELVAAGGLDVVLMDVQMPVMDGMEATRRIRQLPPPDRDVPILALTANVMPAERVRYLASGMNHCLTKPVVWPDLFAALAAVAVGRPAPPPQGDAVPLPIATPDAPLLDRGLLDGLAQVTPPELFRNLLTRGLDGAKESVQRLHAALAEGAELAGEAHRLRGTAGTFGLARISALAAAIEEGSEERPRLLAHLDAAVTATRQAALDAGLIA